MILFLAVQLLSLEFATTPEVGTVPPALAGLRAGDAPQAGGSCPANAPLLCDNSYCCPQDSPYCCPGQECGATSSCGAGGGDDGGAGGGGDDGGGTCGPGEDACEGACCPAGSVCGAPGTGRCCPSATPYHCPSQETCSADSNDPCGNAGDDGGESAASNSGSDGDGGDATGVGGGAGTCPADASGYPGLPADIQVWSQCATACSYCGVGNEEGVSGSCEILEAWDPSYAANCPYCARDCSTPSGDQGDPESVTTENDAFGGCTLGGRGFGMAPLLLLLAAATRSAGRRATRQQ